MRFSKGLMAAALIGAASLGLAQGIAITVDGQPLRFSGMGPRSVNGRVLVPLRGIFEALGAVVTWDSRTQTVGAVKGDTDLRLRIGDRIATVNGREVLLDVSPQVMSGSTMVPLRFIGEALGAEVGWDATTSTVRIVSAAGMNRTGNVTSGTMGAAPTITSFRLNADSGWIRSGREVEFVLEGTPGARASFEIPGVTRGRIQMNETSPGRYVGVWRPVGNESISGASALGYISLNGQERIIQAGSSLSVDVTPPKIRNVIPDKSRVANPRPTIAVILDDQGGSGMDTDSVVLRVNGVDRAREAQINENLVSYTPRADLPAGENQIEFIARDKAGNEVRGIWTFIVTQASDIVKSLTHTGTRNLEPGDTLTVTLQGEPGGRATFSIGRTVIDRPMRETSPGVYVGEYVVRKGDVFNKDVVTASLTTSLGSSFNIEAAERVGFVAGSLGVPTITSPAEGDRVSSPLIVRGRADKGSRVRVRIEYSALALGILRLTGAVYDRVVETDANGNWSTGEIRLEGAAGTRGADYTVSVTSVAADGKESEAATMRLKKQ